MRCHGFAEEVTEAGLVAAGLVAVRVGCGAPGFRRAAMSSKNDWRAVASVRKCETRMLVAASWGSLGSDATYPS